VNGDHREILETKEDWVLKDSKERWVWKENLDQQDLVAVLALRWVLLKLH